MSPQRQRKYEDEPESSAIQNGIALRFPDEFPEAAWSSMQSDVPVYTVWRGVLRGDDRPRTLSCSVSTDHRNAARTSWRDRAIFAGNEGAEPLRHEFRADAA